MRRARGKPSHEACGVRAKGSANTAGLDHHVFTSAYRLGWASQARSKSRPYKALRRHAGNPKARVAPGNLVVLMRSYSPWNRPARPSAIRTQREAHNPSTANPVKSGTIVPLNWPAMIVPNRAPVVVV